MKMSLKATVYCIILFWVGALTNATLGKISINRLLASSLRPHPSTKSGPPKSQAGYRIVSSGALQEDWYWPWFLPGLTFGSRR
jgi:hypothetical protein